MWSPYLYSNTFWVGRGGCGEEKRGFRAARTAGGTRSPDSRGVGQPWGGRGGTVGVGTDGAALSEGNLGVGAVGGILAHHLVAQDVAAVADADPARFWFPHVLVVVPEPILDAAPGLDWDRAGGSVGRAGKERARLSPLPSSPSPLLPSSGSHQSSAVTQEKLRNKLFPHTLEFKQKKKKKSLQPLSPCGRGQGKHPPPRQGGPQLPWGTRQGRDRDGLAPESGLKLDPGGRGSWIGPDGIGEWEDREWRRRGEGRGGRAGQGEQPGPGWPHGGEGSWRGEGARG